MIQKIAALVLLLALGLTLPAHARWWRGVGTASSPPPNAAAYPAGVP